MKKENRRVAVVGGGASGMMAAIAAAEHGAAVTVFEHKDRVGKKLLSTGNGRCNLSNVIQTPDCYRGAHPEFAGRVLAQFGMPETLRFFSDLGIYVKNKGGGFYPHSEQASAVLDVLRFKLSELHIDVRLQAHVDDIRQKDSGFLITAGGRTERFDRVVLAAGSKAAPATGSDGSGYALAKKLGHHIIEPLPSLVQLRSGRPGLKGLAGVRCDGTAVLCVDGQPVCRESGELQWTDYGISGIPVFQLSGLAARSLKEGRQVEVLVDFLPDFTQEQLLEMLHMRIVHGPYKRMEEFFIGLFHKKLCMALLREAGCTPALPCTELSDVHLMRLAQAIRAFPVPVDGVNSFDKAQTCTGGVDTMELTDSMESGRVRGLYFAGEIVDIDGRCGGYNLQWAWSSGYIAGRQAAGTAEEDKKI